MSEKIAFGSSTLQLGQTGVIDPGHPKSHEVFYVVRDTFLMRNTATKECCEFHEGDIVVMYEGEPHELTNIGDEIAVATWSCAPTP